MADYFLDTSALVKRYVLEAGHQRVSSLCDPATGNQVYVAEVARAEVVAAFCRMIRVQPPRLDLATLDSLIALFRKDMRDEYIAVPTSVGIFDRAADLCRAHPLRAYDAVQLACALTIRDSTAGAGGLPPSFVCADHDLLDIARREGLAVENPATQP